MNSSLALAHRRVGRLRRVRAAASLVAFGLLLLVRPANAERGEPSPDAAPEPASATPVPDPVPDFSQPAIWPRADGRRLRFGVGFIATGGGVLSSHDCTCGVASPGLTLDLGYQYGSRSALFLRLEGGIAVISNFAAAFVVFEATPWPKLSLGLGAGIDGTIGFFGTAFGGYGGVAAPLFVTFNTWSRATWSKWGKKSGSRLGLELVPVFDPGTSMFALRGALTFGWATM